MTGHVTRQDAEIAAQREAVARTSRHRTWWLTAGDLRRLGVRAVHAAIEAAYEADGVRILIPGGAA